MSLRNNISKLKKKKETIYLIIILQGPNYNGSNLICYSYVKTYLLGDMTTINQYLRYEMKLINKLISLIACSRMLKIVRMKGEVC